MNGPRSSFMIVSLPPERVYNKHDDPICNEKVKTDRGGGTKLETKRVGIERGRDKGTGIVGIFSASSWASKQGT